MNVGIEPTVIQQYEETLSYLDSIEESSITDEGEKGEELKKEVDLPRLINRGLSKERATKENLRSLSKQVQILKMLKRH